ncbi:20948_t:CDS:2 [Entrophospora sp. SA101]|nr:20948_t:CDS:2 [Entrophospora sp. SA101]
MSGWENLYNIATGDYHNENLKDSYDNYLKTANALLYKLGNEVTFISRESIKSKPHNSARLFSQLKTCVQKLEDILQNKVTVGNLPSPQPSSISDFAPTLKNTTPTPLHLPLIPFSPLSRNVLQYSQDLDAAKEKISNIKQRNPQRKNDDDDNSHLSQLRSIEDEIRTIESKAEKLNKEINLVSEVNLLYWDADVIAAQLTIIDCDLFRKIDFKKDFQTKDKKNSKPQACLDFHRYLTNSFSHQLITFDNVKSSGSLSRGNGAQHPRESIIAHAVRISYYLLNVYRNFNSFAAIIKALISPEVRRIRRLWSNIPARTNQILKELSNHIKPDNDYSAYKEILFQKLESFREGNQETVVIPWMQPHYEEIKQINQSYGTGKSGGDSSEIVLSPPGARKSMLICSLLEQCQLNIISQELDGDELAFSRKTTANTSTSRTINIDGVNIKLPYDLSKLGVGNLSVHHWLVSRVYLNKQQLIDESIFIEPLIENELLPSTEIYANNDSTIESPTKISQSTEFHYNDVSEDLDEPFVLPKPEGNESLITSNINSYNNNNTNKFDKNDYLLGNNFSKSFENPIIITETTIDPYDTMFENNQNNNNNNDNRTSKTAAIQIPQTNKPTSTFVSPAPSLNPNASVFIPRSHNSLTSPSPGPLPDMDNRMREEGYKNLIYQQFDENKKVGDISDNRKNGDNSDDSDVDDVEADEDDVLSDENGVITNDGKIDLTNGKKDVIEKIDQNLNVDGTPNINIKINKIYQSSSP